MPLFRKSFALAIAAAIAAFSVPEPASAQFRDIPCESNRIQMETSDLRVIKTTCQAARGQSGSNRGGDVHSDNDYLYVNTNLGFVNINHHVAGTRTHMRFIDDALDYLKKNYTWLADVPQWSAMSRGQARFGGIRYYGFEKAQRKCIAFLAHAGSKGDMFESTTVGYSCGPERLARSEDDLLEFLRRVSISSRR